MKYLILSFTLVVGLVGCRNQDAIDRDYRAAQRYDEEVEQEREKIKNAPLVNVAVWYDHIERPDTISVNSRLHLTLSNSGSLEYTEGGVLACYVRRYKSINK